MKTLTVSVASYNIEKFIDQALEPFLSDDVRSDVEVIIVNDGSKDRTSEIAHRYAETRDKIRYNLQNRRTYVHGRIQKDNEAHRLQRSRRNTFFGS